MSKLLTGNVFVAVGNANQSFLRLLGAVDKLSGEGFFGDRQVLIQRGNNKKFVAAHSLIEDFYPIEQFINNINQASLVICHGGLGIMFQAIKAGKLPVVMPRRFSYGEHVDDHQKELVDALAAAGRIVPALDVEDLPKAIRIAETQSQREKSRKRPPMFRLVEEAIRNLE